jgi:dihydroorotate dehydrogenase
LLDYSLLRNILFRFNAETSHNIVEFFLKLIKYMPFLNEYIIKINFIDDTKLHQNIFNTIFKHPIGLAAGFDKNGKIIDTTKTLGFSYSEIGTITLRPQSGNSKPRLFRHIKEKSIQNAMGFNNIGSYDVIKNIHNSNIKTPLGINIGKNKDIPNEYTLNQYKILIDKFKDLCTYIVINISSPNTLNLRDLQNEEFISDIFKLAKKLTSKPILLKLSPDMSNEKAIKLCNVAISSGADGIIATNTTIDYSLVKNPINNGGISGEVLNKKSYEFFKNIAKEFFGKTILISVGGISNATQAYERLKAGASLIQCYSGLIYQGPSMVRNINKDILKLIQNDGYNNISDIIGIDIKNN